MVYNMNKWLQGGCPVCGRDKKPNPEYKYSCPGCWGFLSPAQQKELKELVYEIENKSSPLSRLVTIRTATLCYSAIRGPEDKPGPGEVWEAFSS